ncbi:MAG: portal protein [Nitrospiria bacterium]
MTAVATKTQKPTPLTVEAQTTNSPESEKIGLYQAEYQRWLAVLGTYQTNRFDVNYRQYTAYSDTRGTDARISDPVAPELVERAVQKIFERPPKFYVLARGHNLPKELTTIIEGTAQYAWSDPSVVQDTGSMREKLKVGGREFCVAGNTAVETFYNRDAEAPDIRIIPIEDIVFDPTKTLKRSDVYYIRQFVSLDYLLEHQELTKDGKVISGRFKNIEQVQQNVGAATIPGTIKMDPSPYLVTRSGQQIAQRPVDQILLISRWEGKHCCRIANWTVIVEEFDNDILEDDPLDFAMDIEVPKQPYAYSLLDFLNGLTHLKDLLANQVADFGSKALNPPLYVDPAIASNPANRQSLRNAFKLGGIVMAAPTQVGHLPMPPLPTFGFEMLTYIQQRAESVTGLGSAVNSPNSVNKLARTATEIQAQADQMQSPIRDRQINLEESIIEPVTNKMLKYMAALMGKNETKEIFITGQSPKWVKITKNLLQGNITLGDLVIAGLVSIKPGTDPNSGQPITDPQTGQPVINPQTDYPVLSDADQLATDLIAQGKDPKNNVIFDVDWIVRVETGSMAEQDSAQDIQNIQDWVNFRLQFRIPTDLKKISEEIGLRMGIKDPSQYDLDTEDTPPGQQPERNASTLPFIFPHESINFGDVPNAGKIQMAQNAGIQLTPEDLAASPPDSAGRFPYAHTPQDYASSFPPGQPGQAGMTNPAMGPMQQGQPQMMPGGIPNMSPPAPPLNHAQIPGPQPMFSPGAAPGPGPGMAQGQPKHLPNMQPTKIPAGAPNFSMPQMPSFPSLANSISKISALPGAATSRAPKTRRKR